MGITGLQPTSWKESTELTRFKKRYTRKLANAQSFSHTCPSCTSREGKPKRTYATKRDAKRVRRALKHDTMRIYPCPIGGGFHLGHSVQKEGQHRG